jgi:hypothetical protein
MKQIMQMRFAYLLVGLILISTMLHNYASGFDNRTNRETLYFPFSYTDTDSNQYKTERPVDLKYKNKTAAQLYSLGFTAGAVMFAASFDADYSGLPALLGIIAGPSAGSVYAHDWTRAVQGALIRSGSLAMIVVGTYLFLPGLIPTGAARGYRYSMLFKIKRIRPI